MDDGTWTVSGSVTTLINGHGDTLPAALLDWRRKAGDGSGSVEWVWQGDDEDTGRGVVAICENCELPIYEEEPHCWDSDGVHWHKADCVGIEGEP